MRTILKVIKDLWLRFARVFGKANTAVLLAVTYFLVIGFAACIMRLVGLRRQGTRKNVRSTFWEQKPTPDNTLKRHTYQF